MFTSLEDGEIAGIMGARILIIEDDSASMELMRFLLKSFGDTTMLAFDGEDGLRLAASASPNLSLCDVNLPGMSAVAEIAP